MPTWSRFFVTIQSNISVQQCSEACKRAKEAIEKEKEKAMKEGKAYEGEEFKCSHKSPETVDKLKQDFKRMVHETVIDSEDLAYLTFLSDREKSLDEKEKLLGFGSTTPPECIFGIEASSKKQLHIHGLIQFYHSTKILINSNYLKDKTVEYLNPHLEKKLVPSNVQIRVEVVKSDDLERMKDYITKGNELL